MGGKTKQSQRTKNNARPSSSSRSAELLNTSVSLDGGLVTRNGVVLPALFPTLAAVSLDQGLNPEFQMCIKKLNKKDPITRAKALQELCELVNNGNVDDVVAALPSWTHFYKTLTADTDRKVREMTQVCHGTIARCVGRRLAPHLKSLLPAWLQAQYDEHAPAQTTAQNSLKSTFPDSKLPEVISFCKAEVMAHFIDNLIGNTEAIITKKIENPEERNLQMSRIITSSLRGLEYFTPNLPAAHHDWLWEELTPLLEANAFWKFSSNTTHHVRAAWFAAMGRIIERYNGQFGDKYGLKTIRLLLNAARETNALVAAHIWTCLLQFMHHVQDWQKYLDKKELLIKRILDVLETGGWGDARHLSTVLLPLLANLPEDVLTKQFYEAFFNAIYKGLDQKNIMSSKSERQSWITSLAECLRYLSIQQHDFVVEVATSVHRTLLEKVLSTHLDGQTRNNLIKCSASNMSLLVKYWLKQSKEGNSEKFDQLLRNFWQNIGATIVTQIDKCSTDLAEIEMLIEGHILLLQSLKTSFLQEAKKQQSIKFDGDEQSTPEKKSNTTPECDASIIDRYKHNLDDSVYKICAHYFESAQNKQISNPILTPLITLLIEFESKNLFVALARQFDVDSAYKFFDKVLRTWLTGDTMRCKAVVDIVFLIMKHLNEEEQDAMLDSFKQFPPSVVEWCLSVSVSHPYVLLPSVCRWLRSPAASSALWSLCRRGAQHSDGKAAALLLACLREAPDGEPLVSSEGVSQVVQTVTSAMTAANGTLEYAGGLGARLVTSLATTPKACESEHFAKLVLGLFKLNVVIPRGDSRLSLETWCEIRSSWQDGVAALPDEARQLFLTNAADLLHSEFFQDIENLNIQKIDHIVSLCPHLFNRSLGDDSDLPTDVTEIITFTKQTYNMEDKESISIETCALRHECVTSQLNCLYDDDNDAIKNIVTNCSEHDIEELSKSDLVLYVNKVLLRAIYLRTLLLHKVCDEDDEDSEQQTWCDTLLRHKYMEEQFCNIVYNYMVVQSLYEGYTFWPHYSLIQETYHKLSTLITDVIAATSPEVRHIIVTSLSELAASKGYYWAYAHRWYSNECDRERRKESGDEAQEQMDVQKLEETISGNGFFHMLQANTKYSKDESSVYKTAYLVMIRSWNVAHSRFINEDFLSDMATCKDDCNLCVIANAYYRNQSTMLYEMDISEAPWSQVVSNVTVVEFLTLMVKNKGWEIPGYHWDFTTISLCSLLSSVLKTKDRWGSVKVAMLTRSVLNLFEAVRSFVVTIRSECERRQPPKHVADLMKEWTDIFAPDINDNIYSLIVHILNTSETKSITGPQAVVLTSLISTAPNLQWDVLPSARANGDLSLERLARCPADALQKPTHPAHKYLAYYLLENLSMVLVFDDSRKLTLWSEDNQDEGDVEKQRPQFSLDLFHGTFSHLQEIVDAALTNIELGEEICELVAMSDSHCMTLSWLLLADAMALMCSLARGDLMQFYIQIYRERKYAPPLLASSLRLLPGEVFAYATDNTGTTPAPAHCEDMFLAVKPFDMNVARSGADVPCLSCRCVLTAVCGAGCGAARGWAGALRPRHARLLERLVTAYVAPWAVKLQLSNLHMRASEIEDTEIRIAWSSSEVTCSYSVEESVVELRVWLSRAHPLCAPRLAAAGPATNTHWLALYLAYQNGTLLNALKMWTRAVNARVEKSPQCYICYCRLHPATGHLPKVPCHQCKNKFHNLCLRKWFATSNKSNCPLCRAAF